MSYPDAWGLQYEEVQGLTWLAYKNKGTPGRWSLNGSNKTWNLVNVYEKNSFRAVVVKNGQRTILSLSGTDDAADWIDNVGQGLTGVSGQYLYALKIANATAPDIVVGHSLGGGMASYCAIYGRRPAATINPAPLNINIVSGVQMIRNGNLVINYVVGGEVLDVLDTAMVNMRKVGRTYRVGSHGGFNPIERHSIANLDGFAAPQKIQ